MKALLLLTAGCAMAQTPDIDQIMSRVAINQAKSQELRTEWVYHQKQLLRMIRGGSKVAREEHREYTIAPKVRGIHKQLTAFDGKYEQHGKYFSYDKPGYTYKEMDIDGELINDLSNELTDDHKGKDGVSPELFPLTYHQQLKYNFKLLGTEARQGRQVYRVQFEPKPHAKDFEGDTGAWKGEALIDAEEFQPVLVHTALAIKIPLLVKTMLGTNIKGLGFSVSYQKFADGVWFPVSYGGEFEVRAVFFYGRKISVSMVNSDFKRADVTSNVAYVIEDK